MADARALVTGAGKRIGRAIAVYLAERGYAVAVHYNASADEAQDVVDQIKGFGGNACALKADLLNEEDTATLVERTVAELGGPLTLLVNNASIFEYDNISSMTRTSWDRAIESNLRAPVLLTQDFAAQVPDPVTDADGELVAQGLVVNMLDQRVRKLTPEFMSYTIAKMGLWAFTRTAAQGLGPRVRVNGIGPGPTVQGTRQSLEHFTTQRQATLLERGADPTDVCAALGFLIDARTVTGQMICVDGGQHLAWKTEDVLGVE